MSCPSTALGFGPMEAPIDNPPNVYGAQSDDHLQLTSPLDTLPAISTDTVDSGVTSPLPGRSGSPLNEASSPSAADYSSFHDPWMEDGGMRWGVLQNHHSLASFSPKIDTVSEAFIALVDCGNWRESEEGYMLLRLSLYQGWLPRQELLKVVDWDRLRKLAAASAASHGGTKFPLDAMADLLPSTSCNADISYPPRSNDALVFNSDFPAFPVDNTTFRPPKLSLSPANISRSFMTMSPEALRPLRPSVKAEICPSSGILSAGDIDTTTSHNGCGTPCAIAMESAGLPANVIHSRKSSPDPLQNSTSHEQFLTSPFGTAPRSPSPMLPSDISPNITIAPDSLSTPPKIPSYMDSALPRSPHNIQRTSQSLHVTDPISETTSLAPKRRCDHCQVDHTTQWRMHPQKDVHLCNACGQYLSRQGKPRPLDTINTARSKPRASCKDEVIAVPPRSTVPEKRGGEVIMRVSTKHARRNSHGEETVQLCEPPMRA
ncbi:hypothetical protein R3P38DRAFT_2933060 [Favolaschia claudopus]|uniref:GATA-type domain-containing protein n=1 Tax=Favolaschia claudopus TaxID=2862362 RepID=A0AAW0BT87_9AGAR